MSSFRPNYKSGGWREREAQREAARKEAERKAAEEAERKRYANTETNFPTLTTARPVSSATGNQYAKLAEKWARDDEVDRKVEEYRRQRADRERYEFEGMYMPRFKPRMSSGAYEEEEYVPQSRPSVPDTNDEWTEVKRKTRKQKRELTVDEMDRIQDEYDREEQDDVEVNGELFESNRHDHDRV